MGEAVTVPPDTRQQAERIRKAVHAARLLAHGYGKLATAYEMGQASAAVDALVGSLETAREDLRAFGRHVPPCPRWITSGETLDGSEQPCYCGLDDALAACGPSGKQD